MGQARTEGADGAAGNDGRERPRLDVAHDATAGRQGGEDQGGVLERLRRGLATVRME